VGDVDWRACTHVIAEVRLGQRALAFTSTSSPNYFDTLPRHTEVLSK
jgi:hypothetical protein